MKNQTFSSSNVSRNVAFGLITSAIFSGCASNMTMNIPSQAMFSQSALPDPVKVPDGHKVMLETVGVGEITYECRAKTSSDANPPASGFEWVFVSPKAKLNDRRGKMIGKYFGPPATWESLDGSKVSGAQVAVSPAVQGSIPLQLVKANPAMGAGQMQGVTYIQRVATQGGVAPAMACDASRLGHRNIVSYQADYIFWTMASN